MATLCLDCSTGISGDMTVAALLDLGASQEKLRSVLASLDEKHFDIRISRVNKAALDMMDFDVILSQDNHDHDMTYLHGHDHCHHEDCKSTHTHGEHSHKHSHTHVHAHSHRSLLDIALLINQTCATDRAKALAIRIFEILAQAEAKAHGKPISQVHFHEVGAIDSIVDILSVAVCLDDLNVEKTILRTLNEGFGTVRCQHGILPIPVPAVANIATEHQLPLRFTDIEGELITPTGAAILAALKPETVMPESYRISAVGMGAGKRQYSRPSFVRAMLLETNAEQAQTDQVIQLQTNIDDCSGEMLGLVMEKLLNTGALDVVYSPIFMKKNRPAYQLTVLCKDAQRAALEAIIFKETTSIGIRRSTIERTILKREIKTLTTPLGDVLVKVCSYQGETFYYPEFESVKTLAEQCALPFKTVLNQVIEACNHAC